VLIPVAFPGDLPVEASESGGQQSDDFNVMTARSLPRPEVTVEHDGSDLPAGGLLALYAVDPVTVNGIDMARDDLILTETGARVRGHGPVIAARLFGLT
jgi:environmental stress-induced protein Ves